MADAVMLERERDKKLSLSAYGEWLQESYFQALIDDILCL